MFEWILNIAFPNIGYIAGLICTTATMKMSDFLAFLYGSRIEWHNLLTGELHFLSINIGDIFFKDWIWNPFTALADFQKWLLEQLPFLDLPVWIAIFALSISVFVVNRIIKSRTRDK